MANCPGCGQYLADCQVREEEIKGMKVLSCWKCKRVIGTQPIQSSSISRIETKTVYRESSDMDCRNCGYMQSYNDERSIRNDLLRVIKEHCWSEYTRGMPEEQIDAILEDMNR